MDTGQDSAANYENTLIFIELVGNNESILPYPKNPYFVPQVGNRVGKLNSKK